MVQPGLEVENVLVIDGGKLFAKTLQVAKRLFVDEADEAEEFEQGVLERGRREQQLGNVFRAVFKVLAITLLGL